MRTGVRGGGPGEAQERPWSAKGREEAQNGPREKPRRGAEERPRRGPGEALEPHGDQARGERTREDKSRQDQRQDETTDRQKVFRSH